MSIKRTFYNLLKIIGFIVIPSSFLLYILFGILKSDKIISTLFETQNPEASTNTQLLAFPGAEGFGAQTIGGRGGKVYEITNVNDSGEGSLRECVNDSKNVGARICIFKVGGLISLNSPLLISKPYITIAGQTAPGGGITIKLGTASEVFSTKTHDVVIRYISVRPGPGGSNHANQIASNGNELYNIIIDHNSLSWGVDSIIETWYRAKDVTIQWSIASEGLNNSTHPKGAHSKGIMIGGFKGSESNNTLGTENVSVLSNLMAHDAERTPLIQMCGIGQVINNVIYNPQWAMSHQQLNCIGTGYEGTSYVNWINNYYKKGPSSDSSSALKFIPRDTDSSDPFSGVCSSGKAYLSGNVLENGTFSYGFSGTCTAKKTDIIATMPAVAPTVTTSDAQTAYSNLLAEGGVGNSKGLSCDGIWFNRRDGIDTRIINDVKNKTGRIIDDPSQVGGWITPEAGSYCVDSDHDGISNIWENSHGLDPNNATDSNNVSPSGYTWIEEYLNGGIIASIPSPIQPTPTPSPVVEVTLPPTSTPIIIQDTPTPTPIPTRTPTNSPSPTRTPTGVPTNTPIPTAVPVQPTSTPVPTPMPTITNTPGLVLMSPVLGEYFKNKSLSGNPVFLRYDNAVNFNWQYGSPDKLIPKDNFSIRWTKRQYFNQGTYTVNVMSDDGIKIFYDNVVVFSRWYDQSVKNRTFTLNTTAGYHTVKIEYYENRGKAQVAVTWREN